MENPAATSSSSVDDETKDQYIKVKVVDMKGGEMHFKVKNSTLLGKLKKSFANQMGISVENSRFLFDGIRVNNEDTPEKLDMIDGDIIEVYQEQQGGSKTAKNKLYTSSHLTHPQLPLLYNYNYYG